MKLRTWLQGAGVAILILFPFCRGLLSNPGFRRMHTPGFGAILALSLVANLILVSLLWMLVGMWLRSTSRWALLRLAMPALVLASLAEIIQIARTGWESTRLWLVVLVVITALTLLLRWRWRREKQMVQLSGAVLIGLGFYCIFIIVQLLHFAMWRQLPNSTSETIPETTNRADRPRIVWILFDELSYQQVFGDRYPSLQLPNLDEFRKSSTLFANTQPIINDTEEAIPSIFLGQVITRVNYTASNQLQVGGATGTLYPFNAAGTPFALARQQGLTTGVAGWYNPYCGMLAPYLNRCYWTDELLEPSVFVQEGFWPSLLHPWALYARIFAHPWKALSKSYRARVIVDLLEPIALEKMSNLDYRARIYEDLLAHAVRLLEPSGPDFVFVHLPLPHPPGFYNRKTQQFETFGQHSYIDNLALTDKTLGQLLAILRQSPRWKNTSVVVCGDHSWRVYMWAGGTLWTPEDEAASHGGAFDPRPLLMVHLAGQTTSATVSEPFPLLKVHDILDDLVAGKHPNFPSH
jgi:hypothetical protein